MAPPQRDAIPQISKPVKMKIRGIPREILSNIYIQPEGILQTVQKFFGDFEWVQDTILYPVDWIYNKSRKSIFERKWLHTPTILNPPYAEVFQSKKSPRAKDEKPLKFHIAHILSISRASQMPVAILLPKRTDKSWYKKLTNQPDVSTLYLENPIKFKNLEGNYMPTAEFKSFIAVVGFAKKSVKIKNDEYGTFLSEL